MTAALIVLNVHAAAADVPGSGRVRRPPLYTSVLRSSRLLLLHSLFLTPTKAGYNSFWVASKTLQDGPDCS